MEKCLQTEDSWRTGGMNISAQNNALLFKNLHKFFNQQDLSWVKLIWEQYYSQNSLPDKLNVGSFWWRDNPKLLDIYKGITFCNVGTGNTVYLWQDVWNNQVRDLVFPKLASFRKSAITTVHQAMNLEELHDTFYLPLTEQAYEQYQILQEQLQLLQNNSTGVKDEWCYIWGNGIYSSVKVYKIFMGQSQAPVHFKWLWKSCCQKRHKRSMGTDINETRCSTY